MQRPLYRLSIVILTLATLAGGVWLTVRPAGPPGVVISSAPGLTASSGAEETTTQTGLTNINTASAEELADALTGIGPVLSERIVAYRDENGPFLRTDQLLSVSGIGPATYEQIGALVTVGAAAKDE